MKCRFEKCVEVTDKYQMVRGSIIADAEQMVLEVYESSDENYLAMKLFCSGENKTDVIDCQPRVIRTGRNVVLSVSANPPKLPTTDREIEAFARYMLQAPTVDLVFSGSKRIK